MSVKVKQIVKQNRKVTCNSVDRGAVLASNSGVPGGIRTHDPLLRRQPLYPLSYRDTLP